MFLNNFVSNSLQTIKDRENLVQLLNVLVLSKTLNDFNKFLNC